MTEDTEAAQVVVVGLRNPEACAVVDAAVRSGRDAVCLVEPFDRATIAHALYHRAAPADWEAPPELVVRVIEQAVAGNVVVPREVVDGIQATAIHPHNGTPTITEEEVGWLRDLSAGATVATIADDYGYSERAMFRRLHDLYLRLGAAGRVQALVAAERMGVLRDQE